MEPRLAVRETSGSVGVVLQIGIADTSHQCGEADRQISVTLQAPLGARQLAEAVTGSAIAPFPASRLAAVGYLPAGFSATPDLPQVFSTSGAPWEPRPFDPAVTTGPAWTRYYATPGSEPTLSITQTLAATAPAAGCRPSAERTCPPLASPSPSGTVSTQDSTSSACVSATTSVNGHGGLLLCDTASERAVTWTDGRSTFTLVSYDPQHTALSPDELLRVASSVRAP
ncbi:hypothetical protein [Streptacidiphilus sp. MAP12-16]|uniref:hypothetical protein n=1 Tax=Streptacidiphilus sp. MAP12-16 TaxID=3156300 RepID=UPI0035177600